METRLPDQRRGFTLVEVLVVITNNGSWSIHGRLLPYLEQSGAYSKVRLDVPWDAQRDTGVPTMRIATYVCPSEINDTVRLDSSGNPKVYPLTAPGHSH